MSLDAEYRACLESAGIVDPLPTHPKHQFVARQEWLGSGCDARPYDMDDCRTCKATRLKGNHHKW